MWTTFWDDLLIPTLEWMLKGFNYCLVKGTKYENEPFGDLDDEFPAHKLLEENWKTIQAEALEVVGASKSAADVSTTMFGRIGRTGWDLCMLTWYGKEYTEAQERCPQTMKLLRQCPQIKSALFSIMRPHKHVSPHKGPYKGAWRYHLGLKIPQQRENCKIFVNGKPYSWHEGGGVLFDDTYEHSVVNDTEESRVILFCDVERPLPGIRGWINRCLMNSSIPQALLWKINQSKERQIDQ